MDLDGAKTNPRHFRAGAPQPTSRVHEYCSDCLQSAIIGKRAGYFRGETPPKSQRNPLLATPAAGGHGAFFMKTGKAPRFSASFAALATTCGSRSEGQSAIIGKRAGYFCGKTPPKSKRNPLVAAPAAGGQAMLLYEKIGRRWGSWISVP